MNLCILPIICPQLVKCVLSHCGTCLNHQRPMSVKGQLCLNIVCKIYFNFFTFNSLLNRCRNKIHKEHVDNNDPLAPCKLHHDPHSAREMLLLASNTDEQNLWVSRLSKRIQKCGYKANSSSNNNSNNTDGSKISPR